jgi:hypothetical protein
MPWLLFDNSDGSETEVGSHPPTFGDNDKPLTVEEVLVKIRCVQQDPTDGRGRTKPKDGMVGLFPFVLE